MSRQTTTVERPRIDEFPAADTTTEATPTVVPPPVPVEFNDPAVCQDLRTQILGFNIGGCEVQATTMMKNVWTLLQPYMVG